MHSQLLRVNKSYSFKIELLADIFLEIWEELGITSGDKEKPKSTFMNPLDEFGCFAPLPSEPLLKSMISWRFSDGPNLML